MERVRMPRPRRLRRVLPVLALAVLLAGCAVQTPGGSTQSTTSETGMSDERIAKISQTIEQAVTRVDRAEVELSQTGVASGLIVQVHLADDTPLSADELQAVLGAARDSSWFDPSVIDLIAYGTGTATTDVRAAADELNLEWGTFGAGIAVTRGVLTGLLGPWQEPS